MKVERGRRRASCRICDDGLRAPCTVRWSPSREGERKAAELDEDNVDSVA